MLWESGARPKRAARAARLPSSVVGEVREREAVKGGGEVEAGGWTVRSVVVEGSEAGSWLGTARGVGMGPVPPAGRAVAWGAEGVVVVVGVEEGGGTAAVSSSQSISSSVGGAAVGAGVVGGVECSLSCCWRRATRSAFLPVCGRERALRRSSSSAFLRLE